VIVMLGFAQRTLVESVVSGAGRAACRWRVLGGTAAR
jgi:hypothetical protein